MPRHHALARAGFGQAQRGGLTSLARCAASAMGLRDRVKGPSFGRYSAARSARPGGAGADRRLFARDASAAAAAHLADGRCRLPAALRPRRAARCLEELSRPETRRDQRTAAGRALHADRGRRRPYRRDADAAGRARAAGEGEDRQAGDHRAGRIDRHHPGAAPTVIAARIAAALDDAVALVIADAGRTTDAADDEVIAAARFLATARSTTGQLLEIR